jgi:hypothetical protein
MAGDWIKTRKSLPTDGRIVRMASALKADRFRTLGGIVSAWCLFDEHTDCGRLEGYTPEMLDEVIGFPGLAAAMEAVGWLEVGEGFLVAPRFEKHNGKTAKRRAQETERKRSARHADGKRTREEKRIEEIIHASDEACGGVVLAVEIEKIRNAYPRRTHPRETLVEIAAAVRRAGGAGEVLAGVQAIARAVAGWTEGERLQFLKPPPAFFAGDHWRDDPAFWASKTAARKAHASGGRADIPLDLGGRKPKGIRGVPQGMNPSKELEF